ncbi:MAG: hypothetical protein M0009_02310 [Deltaproteobacteria bacterium]|nr:hypothetical protein [Deltaproteobacteria bacterium]
MKLSRIFVFGFIVVLALGVVPGVVGAEEFKIAVVQIDQDDPQAYQPLAKHLARRGVAVKLVEVQTYEMATKMFTEGQVDAMFSGSGIPGSMFVIHRLKLKQALTGYKPKATRIQQAKISN